MQLKLRYGLAMATSALLGHTVSDAVAAEPWKIDAGLLVYQEQDNRVQDLSFKSVASKSLGDDDKINFSVQLDSLTGASPNGAIALEQPQTLTRPSGNDSYDIAAGNQPLDDTFLDTRAALSGGLTRGLNADSRYTIGLSLSKEYDYLHLGTNASYSRDLNNKNTTLSAGFAIASDQIEAVGGTPVPLSAMGSVANPAIKEGDQSKTIIDGLFGVTQIINRRSLVQLNYSFSLGDGYLNDPYKVLTVLDGETGEPLASTNPGMLQYRYESRPDTRTGHNFYFEYKYRLDSGIANFGYRFHTDDWGLDSHTLEARYRWLINDKHFLEPHLRYYNQSAADFYEPFLVASALPEHASSDYRLGAFNGVTLGLLYNRKIGKGKSFGISAETYQTSGDSSERSTSNGQTRTVDYPDLAAWIVQLNYKLDW